MTSGPVMVPWTGHFSAAAVLRGAAFFAGAFLAGALRAAGFAADGFAEAGLAAAGLAAAGFAPLVLAAAGGFTAAGFDVAGFTAAGFAAGGFDTTALDEESFALVLLDAAGFAEGFAVADFVGADSEAASGLAARDLDVVALPAAGFAAAGLLVVSAGALLLAADAPVADALAPVVPAAPDFAAGVRRRVPGFAGAFFGVSPVGSSVMLQSSNWFVKRRREKTLVRLSNSSQHKRRT